MNGLHFPEHSNHAQPRHAVSITERPALYVVPDRDTLKRQVVAINKLLSDIYRTDTRVSTILERHGFAAQQIAPLRAEHLPALVPALITIFRTHITAGHDGQRHFRIVQRRYALDGRDEQTLEAVAQHWGVTRERIRQLQKRTLQRARSARRRAALERAIVNIATELIGEPRTAPPTPLHDFVPPSKHVSPRLAEIRKEHRRAGLPWTPGEEAVVRTLFAQSVPIDDIAAQLERQPSAIQTRLIRLGLVEAPPNYARPAQPAPPSMHAELHAAIISCVATFPGQLTRTNVGRILVSSPARSVQSFKDSWYWGKYSQLARTEVVMHVDYLIVAGQLQQRGQVLFPAT